MYPGIKIVIKNTEQKFEDSLTNRQQMTADLSTIETSLAEKLKILIYDAFVAWQLSCFYEILKLKLKRNEIDIYYYL
jgi:hypothetical protein